MSDNDKQDIQEPIIDRSENVRQILVLILAIAILFVFFLPKINGSLKGTSSILFSFTLVFIFAAMALTLNLEVGYLGIPNFGKVAFVAVGGYTYAIVLDRMVDNPPEDLSGIGAIANYYGIVIFGLIMAMVMSGLFGILLTLPTLKLREDYLAIVTIVAGEIVRNVANNEDFFNSFSGFSVDNPVFLQFEPKEIIQGTYMNFSHFVFAIGAISLIYLYAKKSLKNIDPSDEYAHKEQIQRVTSLFTLLTLGLIIFDYFEGFGLFDGPSLGFHLVLGSSLIILVLYKTYLAKDVEIDIMFLIFYILTLGNFVLSFFSDPFSNIQTAEWFKMLFALFTLLVIYAVMEEIYYSPFGRTLRAIREDDTSAISVGKSIFSYRLRALVIASALTGLAGAVYAQIIQIVAPKQYEPLLTFTLYIMLIIGGTGNNKGVIFGAFMIQLLFQITRGSLFADAKWFYPDIGAMIGHLFNGNLDYVNSSRQIGPENIGIIAVGVMLIVFLIYAPDGLIPEVKKNNERYYALTKHYESKEDEKDGILEFLKNITNTKLETEEWISD